MLLMGIVSVVAITLGSVLGIRLGMLLEKPTLTSNHFHTSTVRKARGTIKPTE